jgi:hypothetical protein
LLRRISSGCIRYFYDHEMLDPVDHYLRQGYHAQFPAAGESYISPGSPYWACHGLFALYFDREDAFWTAVEAPLPVEQDDFDIALPGPGFAVSGRRATGQVFLLNSRAGIEYDSNRYNYSAKYGKLIYSTHFPFNVLSASGSYAPDAMIALIGEDGLWGHRQTTRHSGIAPGMMWCDFNEMVRGEPQKIRTALCLWRDVQIRMAYIIPTLPVRAAEAPGALGCDRAASVTRMSDTAAGWEYVEAEERAMAIRRLYGYDGQQVSAPFQGYSNINLAYPYAEMPLVCETAFSVAARGLAAVSLMRPASFNAAAEFKDIMVSCDPRGIFRANLPDDEMIIAPLGFETVDVLLIGHLEVRGTSLRCVRIKRDASEICGMNISEVNGVVQLCEPATIQLKRGLNGQAYLSTSSGLTLAEGWLGGSPRRVEAKTLAGEWEDVSRRCAGGEIPASLVAEWARRNERTLIEFRVQL